jgi:hypothetical protein
MVMPGGTMQPEWGSQDRLGTLAIRRLKGGIGNYTTAAELPARCRMIGRLALSLDVMARIGRSVENTAAGLSKTGSPKVWQKVVR